MLTSTLFFNVSLCVTVRFVVPRPPRARIGFAINGFTGSVSGGMKVLLNYSPAGHRRGGFVSAVFSPSGFIPHGLQVAGAKCICYVECGPMFSLPG